MSRTPRASASLLLLTLSLLSLRYHTDCMGMDDEMVALVDVFICPRCEPCECRVYAGRA